jgi:hypothetical protein
MVKVEGNIATREPLPAFLQGLLPESLVDLSWTDPALGVQDVAWWPEEHTEGELGVNKKWGAEVLTLDSERKVVKVARKQVAMTAAEKAAQVDAMRPHLTDANNAQYDAAIALMTCDYPAAEITTWERQRAEVIAWSGDSTAATPWIDIATSARGLDREEYLSRTLAKVNAFAIASAYLTGRRQGIDDQIRAATTAEELAAVVIDYTLPGA